MYLFGRENNTPIWSHTFYEYPDHVYVSISADGEYIVAGSENEKVYLYNKDSGTPLWSYDTGDFVQSVAISVDGEYIAVGGDNDKIYLFGKDSNTPIWTYETDANIKSVTELRPLRHSFSSSNASPTITKVRDSRFFVDCSSA